MSNPKVIKRPPGSPPPTPVMTDSARPERGVPLQKTIPREVVGAKQEAERIVREAEVKAQRIVEEAESAAEEIRERAWNEGKQEALAKYTQEVLKAKHAYDHLIVELEPRYIQLVRTCVERIVGKELETHPELIVDIVRSVLRDAAQQREITVRVHPEDQEALKRNKTRLLDILARAGSIEFRADPAMTRGGCVVVTELGTIDASLDRQLQAIEEALQEELEYGDPNAEPAADEEPAEAEGEDAEAY